MSCTQDKQGNLFHPYAMIYTLFIFKELYKLFWIYCIIQLNAFLPSDEIDTAQKMSIEF